MNRRNVLRMSLFIFKSGKLLKLKIKIPDGFNPKCLACEGELGQSSSSPGKFSVISINLINIGQTLGVTFRCHLQDEAT